MGVDFYTCDVCGNTFCDCGPYARCDECDGKLCPDCMEKYEVFGNMTKENCPFCNFKEVSEETLLAFLINEIGSSHEGVKELFVQKYKNEKRKMLPLEEMRYKEGYRDAVTNYAVWRDGGQFVGVLEKPLYKVLEEIEGQDVPIRY